MSILTHYWYFIVSKVFSIQSIYFVKEIQEGEDIWKLILSPSYWW